jgi:AcrR family transcriptional regulator
VAGVRVVSTPEAVGTSAVVVRLVVAAERLFALHGIDGVSLRQISAEAGSANNSAVHYHFGSKQGLVSAIFRHRLPQIVSERRLLAARCDPDDVRSRFEAHYLPVLNLAEAPDNHYISFVEQLHRQQRGSGPDLVALPEEGQRSNEELHRDLSRLLAHLDEPVRQMRIVEAQLLCVHAAADRELSVARDAVRAPFELFTNSLLDGLTGFLSAPASSATMRRVERVERANRHDLRMI